MTPRLTLVALLTGRVSERPAPHHRIPAMPEPRFTLVETFIIQSVRSAVDAMACIAILGCIAIVCLAMGA